MFRLKTKRDLEGEFQLCVFERELDTHCNHTAADIENVRGMTEAQKKFCLTLYEQGKETVGVMLRRFRSLQHKGDLPEGVEVPSEAKLRAHWRTMLERGNPC